MIKTQKIGVSGFLYKDGKVLALRRSDQEKFLSAYWELPGGKVEFGESPEEAIVREFKEETNLSVQTVKIYSTFSYLSENNSQHTVDMQFIVSLNGPIDNLEINKEHSEFRWFAENEIDRISENISEKMKNAIKKGFNESEAK
jgi:8-oxo-dGTP diphosphatase